MKREEIKELSTDEIKLRLVEEKHLLTKMKMNHAVSAIENPLKIRATRRGIAQLETELTQRNNSVKTNV